MHTRLTDLGVAAIPFALGLVGPGAPGSYEAGWRLALGAGIGASLYWRRRFPAVTLAACFGLGLVQLAVGLVGGPQAGGPQPGVLPGLYDLGIIIAIYSAVAYGTRAARLAAVAGGAAGAAAGALVWATGVRDSWNQAFAVCVLFAPVLLAWALGTAARTRRAYLVSLEDRAARLQREREALARAAVAEERIRIARELHDIIAHGISLMIVQSDGADAAIEQDNTGEARTAVAAIGRTGRAALTDLRLLVGMLRNDRDGAEPQPGIGQLQDLVDSVPLKVRLHVDGEPRELPHGLALAVFRIVQEALTNTVKHAGPDASADVRLSYESDAVEVEVTDDGHVPGPPGGIGQGLMGQGLMGQGLMGQGLIGHGLIGMRERTAMFGGTFTAGPRAVGGFRVLARLPWT